MVKTLDYFIFFFKKMVFSAKTGSLTNVLVYFSEEKTSV